MIYHITVPGLLNTFIIIVSADQPILSGLPSLLCAVQRTYLCNVVDAVASYSRNPRAPQLGAQSQVHIFYATGAQKSG